MAINVSSVQHNGGFLPGIILLTQCYNRTGGFLPDIINIVPLSGFRLHYVLLIEVHSIA